MIQSKLLSRKILEFQIEEYIRERIKRAGFSHVKLQMTPLGEKIIIYSSRPGLVVGRKGQNIKQLTKTLKKKFFKVSCLFLLPLLSKGRAKGHYIYNTIN